MTLPTRPRRLACVGHASLDHVFEVRAFPSEPVKTPAQAYRPRGGGMSFNAAIAAARLGASVRLLSRVGDDAAAEVLRRSLRHEQVDAQGVEAVAGTQTSASAVIVDAQGERHIFNHRGNALLQAHSLDTAQLQGADAILTDPRWPAGAQAALRWARRHGVLSMLDADVAPPQDLRRLVRLARWAVFSQSGLAAFAPSQAENDALLAALKLGCEVAVVTQGRGGARWTRGQTVHQVLAPQVESRDTTAAGDVFHAALALALAESLDDQAALSWACAAAALKCQRGDGVFGAPSRDELQQYLAASA